MTYEDGGSEHTSKDGERTGANDIIVEQRGAGLITLDSVLEMDVPAGTRWDQFPDGSAHRLGKQYGLVDSIGSSGLSNNGEDHGELVGDETLPPEVILAVKHPFVPESREPDAVQVETPDDHLGVEVETAEGRGAGGEDREERG
jgi:hypothetical protein